MTTPQQHVNLYADVLRPQREVLSLPVAVAMVVVSLALMAALVVGCQWSATSAANAARLARQQNDALLQQITDRTAQLQQRQPPAALLAQKRQVEADLVSRQALMRVLENSAPMRNPGFANVLRVLAEEADGAVWLTGITLDDHQIRFAGAARQEQDVPQWLDRLATNEPLAAYRFRALSLSRNDDGYMGFELEGQP